MAAGKVSPSQAKNFIARSLRAVADPHPSGTALQKLWKHFNNQCAYCGHKLRPGMEDASYDHLVPNGGNHLGNIVLACGRCNEYEKLNADWDAFLRKKATISKLYHERRSRILDWQKCHKGDHSQVSQVLLEQAEDCIRRAVKSFDRELSKLRAAKHKAKDRR
ncbi:MAG TPA: hypothetical protein VN887_15345 [Candidatus Angelobacter sp.]|nr:hypothetical protein [Candidatus Angelobacter sp.]